MSKDLGQIAELRFQLRATLNGLTVSKPFGDSASYDYIVDNGKRLYKVQVKSSHYYEPHRPNRFSFSLSRGSKKRGYKAKEVDFFAFYIGKLDCFYLIPARLIRLSKSFNLYAYGKFEGFKENWRI